MLNADDPSSEEMARATCARVLHYSLSRRADVTAHVQDATLDEVTETGLRVVVGIPVAGDDDASRTTRLALALIEALDAIGHDVEPELRLAVGIERGTAIVTRDPEPLAATQHSRHPPPELAGYRSEAEVFQFVWFLG